eukprot:GFYU01007819.1.p1 GENE.GFYU01007819.1~~GFYU01007819.1.p1  ORF type:complete len:729 (-),score=210.34 GFYU01007819.1:115-2301(-)
MAKVNQKDLDYHDLMHLVNDDIPPASDLNQLKKIQSVVCEDAVKPSDLGPMLDWVGRFCGENLLELSLRCSGFFHSEIEQIAESCPNLKVITLRSSSHGLMIGRRSFRKLSQKTPSLVSLQLQGVDFTEDKSKNESTKDLNETERLAKRMFSKSLVDVSLTHSKINDEEISELLKAIPGLINLDLSHSNELKSPCLEHRTLTNLKMVQCHYLNNPDFQCKKLKVLNLGDCDNLAAFTTHDKCDLSGLLLHSTKVDNKFLLSVLARHESTLEELDVGWCRYIDEEVLLDVAGVASKSGYKMPCLATLNLSYTKFTGEFLTKVCRHATNLKELKATSAELSHAKIQCPKLAKVTLVESHVGHDTVQPMLTAAGDNMRELRLADSEDIVGSLTIPCPNLEVLDLTGCTMVEGITLPCPDLVELKISRCFDLVEINDIPPELNALKTISMRYISAPGASVSAILNRSPLVQRVAISQTLVTELDLECRHLESFEADECRQLRKLRLVAPVMTTLKLWDSGIEKLSITSGALNSLELKNNQLMEKITLDCPRIDSVSLTNVGIGDAALESLVSSCDKMCGLRIEKCKRLQQPVLCSEALSEFAAESCVNLVSVDLSDCPGLRRVDLLNIHITDESLNESIRKCYQLRRLTIYDCSALKNPVVENGYLEELNMSQCNSVRNLSVSASSLQKLQCTRNSLLAKEDVDTTNCRDLKEFNFSEGDPVGGGKKQCIVQ